MMDLRKKIKESLKWKKSPRYCSNRLGILESDYVKLKKEILSERKALKKNKKYLQKVISNVNVTESIIKN